jgi:putative aldouronate transport system substrate-binding protein
MKGKWFATLLLVMVILIAGCSSNGGNETANNGGNGNQSSTTTESESNSVSESPAESPAEVEWFSTIDFWNPPSVWSTDPNTVSGAITEKTGLTVKFNIPAQDGETKLNLMLVSGNDFPDVVTTTNEVLGKKLIEAGKVWELDEFLKQYDPDSQLLTEFPADVKQTVVDRDGGFYAFPSHINSDDARKVYPPSGQFYVDLIDYGSNGALVVNENILKEAGLTLEDIKTESGLLAAYKKIQDMKLTVNGASVIPLLIDGKSYQEPTLGFLQDSFGAMQVDKDGNYRDKLLAPETKEALEFLYKARKAGNFESGQMTVDNAAVKADMASGRVFTFIGNSANTSFQLNDYWTSSGPILSDEGTTPVLGKNKRAGGGWMKTFISKTTEEPEKLAKWLSFMSSKEGMMLHIYGFEGVHYNLDKDGLLVKTEQGINDAKEYMKTGLSAFWPFHHTTFSYSVQQPPNEETDIQAVTANRVQSAYGKAAETKIYNNAAFSLPGDLFPSESKEANDQLQIKAYKEAQIAKIIMAKDDAAFNKLYDEMISQLKKLGIEHLDEERNKWVQQKAQEYSIEVKGINS